jgi:hypothetical protein
MPTEILLDYLHLIFGIIFTLAFQHNKKKYQYKKY